MCREGGYLPRDLYEKGKARELQRRLGGDFPGNPDPARTDWRTVDDETPGVTFKGKWWQGYNCCGGQCGDKTSWSSATDGSAVAVYPLPVEKAGRYRLMGIVPHLFNRKAPPVASLTIVSGEQKTNVEWNEYPQSGFWQPIGTFDLQPGATLELRRSPACLDKSVAADGFAIVPAR